MRAPPALRAATVRLLRVPLSTPLSRLRDTATRTRMAGTTDLPLTVLTGPTLAPDAALLAIALRARGRAWVSGSSVFAAAAESEWIGVGKSGVYVRTRSLFENGTKVPDVVPADVPTLDPAGEWRLSHRGGALPPLRGSAARADFPTRSVPTVARPASDEAGVGRAALVLAYGAVRTFWPYLDELTPPLDERLLASMQQLETDHGAGRRAVTQALERFAEILGDGHVTVFDRQAARIRSPLAVESIGGDVVVAAGGANDVAPGDVVLAVAGEPTTDILARLQLRVSCSAHVKAVFASARLFEGRPEPLIRIRALDGSERDVELVGTTPPQTVVGLWDRAPGFLADIGAPDVFYVTLSEVGAFPVSKLDMRVVDAGLREARALVLDMRGYPSAQAWSILARAVPFTARGPLLTFTQVTATTKTPVRAPVQTLASFKLPPEVAQFTGPVVLLVGHPTQSQAEHLTSFFKDSKRGKVVGAQTSGANGNITGIQLRVGTRSPSPECTSPTSTGAASSA